jgi:hypothetical protein
MGLKGDRASNRMPVEIERQILELVVSGKSHPEIADLLGVNKNTIWRVVKRAKTDPYLQPSKKIGEFNWREVIPHVEGMQGVKKKASWSQERAEIALGDGKRPVILVGFGDQHIGAYGCNYRSFQEITDEILATPNLYVALMGDYLEMAIRLRGVLEVTAQVLTPEMQEAFLESWLKEIQPKVAFATWDNHGIMRQENQSGVSSLKNLLSRNVHYFNGIGHADLKIGSEIYKSAASHKFRGSSMYNRTHAQGRYIRMEAVDRELVLMGDIHTWGFSQYAEGGIERTCITGGTLHENSGYAKRFFSLHDSPYYPCAVLHHDRHEIVPFKTVRQARQYLGLK